MSIFCCHHHLFRQNQGPAGQICPPLSFQCAVRQIVFFKLIPGMLAAPRRFCCADTMTVLAPHEAAAFWGIRFF